MSMPFTPAPDDEVPTLRKYQVELTLDTLVRALAEQPRRLVTPPPGQAPPDLHPDLPPHLQRIADLADEIQNEINQIRQIDPQVLDRLKLQ